MRVQSDGLRKFLGEARWEVIQLTINVARENGFNTYLVGGIVRDYLLGKPSEDLDIVIEGNALEVAQVLSHLLEVPVKQYPHFLTAHLTFPHWHLDLATSRKEFYKASAAYPDVTPGPIQKDLFRRDFTINAMAVFLGADGPLPLVDPYGGYEDLTAKRIRILHSKSFVDDPSRMLRALRFAMRFKFHLEKRTQSLLDKGLEEGLLRQLNRGRIEKELTLIRKQAPSAAEGRRVLEFLKPYL